MKFDKSIINSLISINTMIYGNLPFKQIFRSISKLGLNNIELSFTENYVSFDEETTFSQEQATSLLKAMNNYGIKCNSISAHINMGMENAIEKMKKRFAFAKNIGANIVVSNAAMTQDYPVFINNLQTISAEAERLGLILALENPGDGNNAILASGTAGKELITKLHLSNIALNFDCNNAFSYNKGVYNVPTDCKEVLPYCVSLHLKDMKQTSNGEWLFTAIGDGDFPYSTFFNVYKQINKTIPLVLELPIQMKRKSDWTMAPLAKPSLDLIESTISHSIQNILRMF